jgi:NADH dehydrogenase
MGAPSSHRLHTPPCRAAWLRCTLLACILVLLQGCGRDAPNLLTLGGIEPPAVEAGDEWTLTGEGFVERAVARVVFAGSVSRAGFASQTESISAETVTVSQGALQLELDAPLVDAFLGSDLAVRHATFRGTVSVAFAPRTPGAPPVMGVLNDVVLDVFRGDPTPGPDEASSRLVRRFGWQLEPNADGEMCVTGLSEPREPGPLVVGDCALRFGELNVFGVADLAPMAFADSARLLIRRDGALGPQLVELDVSGLQEPQPELWRWALGLVGIVVLVLLACTTPLGTALAVVESSLRARGRRRRTGHHLERRLGFAPFLVVSVAFGAAHMGLFRGATDYDVLLVYCGALPLLWLSGLVHGSDGRWTLGGALETLVGNAALSVSSALAVCIPVLHHASLSLNQASLLQGASPLGFFGFSSPGAYLAGAALLLCALLVLLTGHVPGRAQGAAVRLRAHIARALTETHCWALLGLFVILYAGGWQVPGEWRSQNPWRELAAFQLKFSLAYLLFTALRVRVPTMTGAMLRPVYWRWLLPLGATGAVCHLVWVAGQWPDWLQSATAVILCTGSITLLALAIPRLYRPARSEPAVAAINPWL